MLPANQPDFRSADRVIAPGAEVANFGRVSTLLVNQIPLFRQVSGPPRGERARYDSKLVALAREPVFRPERMVAVDMADHYPVALQSLASNGPQDCSVIFRYMPYHRGAQVALYCLMVHHVPLCSKIFGGHKGDTVTPSEYQIAMGQVGETKRAAMRAQTDAAIAAYSLRASTDAERRLAELMNGIKGSAR